MKQKRVRRLRKRHRKRNRIQKSALWVNYSAYQTVPASASSSSATVPTTALTEPMKPTAAPVTPPTTSDLISESKWNCTASNSSSSAPFPALLYNKEKQVYQRHLAVRFWTIYNLPWSLTGDFYCSTIIWIATICWTFSFLFFPNYKFWS